MSRNPSALASLTANYTDSENEDDHNSDENGDQTEDSNESQVIILSRPATPVKLRSAQSTPSKVEAKSGGLRLVNYHDDTVISDDENENDSPTHEAGSPMDIPNDDDGDNEKCDENGDAIETKAKKDRFAEYGFQLPPEPKGKCPADMQEKIADMYDKMKMKNMDMNKLIQERKEFRNPSIYEKLIQFCEIDELGTNYPPELYDPMQWTKNESFFYEELAKVQKADMDKREKEMSKSDLIQATAKKTEEEAKKRKSKWDQPAPSATTLQHPPSVIKPSVLITTSITGTKGTVISAFGSLPKKPKP